MLIFLLYWIISGLIVFGLVQPTIFVFTFKWEDLEEFCVCLLMGGLIVPILALAGILYLVVSIVRGIK